MFATILRHLGNLCYRLNGGLDKVNNRSVLDKLAVRFWAKSLEVKERTKC